MAESGSIAGEPPVEAVPPEGEPGAWRKYALAAGFLAPAAFFLLIWIVYPAISTIYRSFFDSTGDEFVWFDNYTTCSRTIARSTRSRTTSSGC
jgi:alpha-glucoside transport system permease protein